MTIGLLTLVASNATAQLTHGLAIGDVRSDSAVVWGRCADVGTLNVEAAPTSTAASVRAEASVSAMTDLTAQVTLEDLAPAMQYEVIAYCTNNGDGSASSATARFRTAPAADADADVSFLVSGDLGGQAYCRLDPGGYQIFQPMAALEADFFVANGDMIYADNPCPRQGAEGRIYVDGGFPGIGDPGVDWTDRAQLEEIYRAHWKYNRADPAFQRFLTSTPLYVQWDDHEVINDFGGPWPFYLPMPEREGYPTLVETGRQSLFDFHPIEQHAEDPGRIYRKFRWGRHLELFLLDARSYRSRNDRVDEQIPDGDAKTLLGEQQVQWLLDSLLASDATWKVVSSDVPLSIPTGSGASAYGRDAFASGSTPFGAAPDFAARTGFESELLRVLAALDAAQLNNLVFVATDVHFAAQLRYERDFDGDGEPLIFYELVSGPLSAVKNPAPPALDATLGPVYLYAEGGLFNFAFLRIENIQESSRVSESPAPHPTLPSLIADVRDETGRVRPGSRLVVHATPHTAARSDR